MALSLASSPVMAQLKVSQTVIDITSSEKRASLELINTGDTALSVEVSIEEVFEPTGQFAMDDVTLPVQDAIIKLSRQSFEIPANEQLQPADAGSP